MLRSVPTPRYVTCTSHDAEDGDSKEYNWDPTYISVAQDLLDDELMLQNVFEGKIVSSQIYPLVFDSKGPHKEMSFRSLEFYREVDQNNDIYKQLSFDEKHFFLIGLRDLFVASCRDMLSESEKELLKRIADLIDPNEDDPDIVSKQILNMQVTPYPTRSHKMVRFIEDPADAFSSLSNECFIRNELNMLIGFVDLCELSYHNFENIVNLDSLFDNHFDQFKIINGKQLQDSEVFTFDMLCASDVLETLDKHNLYVQPLNKLSRGGRRFIFSSRTLSNNLTTCLKVYMKHTKIINSQFKFVNWVFRYNKFKPGDRKFVCHYDTPYTDPGKKHHSKYTILLYLSSGKADPVLSFDDGKVRIDSIEANWHQIKGVIFDQKYEHEGKSFIDSDKIFLRSELVYEYDDDEYVSDNQVAKKFNQACYMTKQSLFNPEIEKFVSDAFNQAAEARVGLSRKFQTKDILVYKKLDEIPFITNGYDYWFNKDTDLKDAVVLTIGDFFNCKHESGKYFNKISYQKIINVDVNHDEIFDFLNDENGRRKIPENAGQESQKKNGHQKPDLDDEDDEECREEIYKKVKTIILSNGKDPNKRVSQEEGTEMEIEESSQERETKSEDESDRENEADGEEEEEKDRNNEDENEDEDDEEDDDDRLERKRKPVNCCPDHYKWRLWKQSFDPKTNKDVLRYLKQGQQKEKIDRKFLKKECVMHILDCKMDIQRDNIVVHDTTIRFKNHIPGFNFAGATPACEFCGQEFDDDYFCCDEAAECWHSSDFSRYIKIEKKPAIEYRCLPPIPYITSKKGHHLRLDIFHSDLIRSQTSTIEHYTM